ncbi:hypothetical protein OE88DRAFT_1740195 [Heliocybe sulcata]|uniref:Uncharacterized protein n=1 Tax=Heliocybe sulcata TaxID=5364 RepID=A0A5C3MJV0_9AGAM|nr:hypothetical protein OE88DRAFT_1740195 [Heliocybe sulcata]
MLPDGEEPYSCISDACPQRDAWLTSEILSLDEIRTVSMQSALANFAPTDRDESSHEAPQSAHAPPPPCLPTEASHLTMQSQAYPVLPPL